MLATLRPLIGAAIVLLRNYTLLHLRNQKPQTKQSVAPREDIHMLLADAVSGSSKHAIKSAFGPPHGASEKGFLLADTWYYLLPKTNGVMAVGFEDDTAYHVRIVRLI
jgi:hypothetical protein